MPTHEKSSLLKWVLWLSLPLYIADIITKALIVKYFEEPPPTDSLTVIEDFFHIVRVHNTGIAFGRFNDIANANLLFGGIALMAMLFIIWMWRKNQFPTRFGKVAAGLLVSGILGNLTDRIVYGYVVDFLDFEHSVFTIFNDDGNPHFASFNIADSCISIAAVCLIISAFQKVPDEEEGEEADSEGKQDDKTGH